MRTLRHWLEDLLCIPFTEWCDGCDDTGIDSYLYGDTTPWYCSRCKKGVAMKEAEKRQDRIAGLEREVRR